MDSYTLLSAVSLSEDVSRLHTRSLGTRGTLGTALPACGAEGGSGTDRRGIKLTHMRHVRKYESLGDIKNSPFEA